MHYIHLPFLTHTHSFTHSYTLWCDPCISDPFFAQRKISFDRDRGIKNSLFLFEKHMRPKSSGGRCKRCNLQLSFFFLCVLLLVIREQSSAFSQWLLKTSKEVWFPVFRADCRHHKTQGFLPAIFVDSLIQQIFRDYLQYE